MLNSRRLHPLCFLLVLAGASLVARRAGAAGSIDFDGLAANKVIRYDYVGVDQSGLTFDGDAYILKGLVAPNSPPNVLVSGNLDSEHDGHPLTGTFTTPQQSVSLRGGYFKGNSDPATRQGTLRAFDQNHNLVGTADVHTVDGNQCSTPFSVTDPSGAHIYSFTFDAGTAVGIYVTIDDLRFTGGTPPPPPDGPPVVHITDPPQQGTVDATTSPLLVDGSVDGNGVFQQLEVTLQLMSPPPSYQQAIVQTTTINLGAGQTFSGQLFGNLLMGYYQLTVRATNLAGTGSATVSFTNLPPALRLPGFSWAAPAGNCQMAMYTDSGRAYFPSTNTVIAVPTDIMNKWLSVKSYPILRHDGTLGCPIDIKRSYGEFSDPNDPTHLIIYGHIQDFERGRIYAMADSPLFYTPKVFVDAITAISTYTTSPIGNPPRSFNDPFGLNEVGAPGSDPVTYIYGNDPTWLFQRFARINFTGEPNTLEVRGRNPNPNLYIERLGGGMVDFKAGTRLPNPNEVTPASWDVFQCSWDTQGDGWSCPVSRHHLTSLSTGNCTSDMSPADCQARQVPLYTTQSQIKDDVKFCNANTPYCVFEEDCPQWSAVPDKPLTGWFDGGLLMGADTPSDHIDIQSIGWVQSSNAAKEDLSYDHWNMQGRSVPIVGDLPGFDGTDCANLLTLSGCSILGLCGTGQSLGDAACGGWSDWGFHMRPLAQWVDDPNAAHIRPPDGSIVPPFWNLLGSTASPDNDFHVDSPSVFNNQGSSGDMEIEWEAAWGNNFINAGVPPQPPAPHNTIWSATLVEPPPAPPHEFNWPKVGSLAFVNGRWMLDCGHLVLATPHIYHAEIHPANTLITSEASAAPPAMHILNRVTKAQVWVNQLYEGTPFQTRVWAPPRPSPQSELSALFVNYNGPAGGGTVHNPDGSYTFSLTNYPAGNPATVAPVASTVTAAFTGDGLSVSVAGPNGGPGGSHGIEWQSGQPFYPGDHYANGSGAVGEFIGRWYVGWSCETIKVASQFVYTCAAIP